MVTSGLLLLCLSTVALAYPYSSHGPYSLLRTGKRDAATHTVSRSDLNSLLNKLDPEEQDRFLRLIIQQEKFARQRAMRSAQLLRPQFGPTKREREQGNNAWKSYAYFGR